MTSSDSFFSISLSLINASWSLILVNGVRKSWLIPDNISDLWFKCLIIRFLILSNSYPACLISNAPEGLYSPISSPRPNLSDAFAKFIIGLVWFFKKISATIINKNAGKVIHKAKILAEELATLSFGITNWKYPFRYLIFKSIKSFKEVVSNQ